MILSKEDIAWLKTKQFAFVEINSRGISVEQYVKEKRRCSCNASTGICGCTTYGTGKLDFNGYWQNPCPHGTEVHTCI